MKNFIARIYINTFVDVEIEAENEKEAIEEANDMEIFNLFLECGNNIKYNATIADVEVSKKEEPKSYAYLLKCNSPKFEEVKPKNGENFTLDELYKYIGTDVIEVLRLRGNMIMVVDENGRLKKKKCNLLASNICGYEVVGNAVLMPSKLLK